MRYTDLLGPIVIPYMIMRVMLNFEVQQATQAALICGVFCFIVMLIERRNK